MVTIRENEFITQNIGSRLLVGEIVEIIRNYVESLRKEDSEETTSIGLLLEVRAPNLRTIGYVAIDVYNGNAKL